jgi:hypothetical protein
MLQGNQQNQQAGACFPGQASRKQKDQSESDVSKQDKGRKIEHARVWFVMCRKDTGGVADIDSFSDGFFHKFPARKPRVLGLEKFV